MLAYLLRYNQDRQASITAALATFHYVGPFVVPLAANASSQPTVSGDTEPLHVSNSEH